MKAFTLYSPEEIHSRQLLRKLQDYGVPNFDDFETFLKLYAEWYTQTFPGCQINVRAALSRNDWFLEFVSFLANKDI